MRPECIQTIENLALTDPNVVVIASDPGAGFMANLAAKHPQRLLIEGVYEQGLAGMAAGMAAAGFYPYIVTLAVFATRRCYEQLLLDFSLHELAGCVVGTGGGLAYGVMGPTHIAVDDLMLLNAIPNSAILAPGDPNECIQLTTQARSYKGLSYMRLAATTESFEDADARIVLGEGRLLAPPASVLFISCGATSLETYAAARLLEEQGIGAGVLHLHTVKPLDVELVRRSAAAATVVLCVEEHRLIGGMASAVLNALTSAEPPITPNRVASVGLDDTFNFGFGDYPDHMDHCGMTAPKLAERARLLLAAVESTRSADVA